MRARIFAALLPLALVGAAAPQVAMADEHESSVQVLHAVPGLTVDVYANGDELLADFAPGTLTDPVMLPAGSYDLKVTAAGAGADGEAAIEANDVTVPGGANITVVAHLDAEGNPTLTPFVNDVAATAAGEGRLTVRHTAAAPAVDVRANEAVAFSNLSNPNEAKADLPAGTVSADVVLTGTSDVAIGPANVEVTEGANTIVYAWGSAADGNLALAVQVIDGLHSAPHGVPGGTGGQAAAARDANSALAIGAAGLIAAGLVLVTARRRAELAE